MDSLTEAKSLAELLAERDVRVVFAESCTAGLVSATLARIAGISQYHCGSAVTYGEDTKTQWLGVSPADLAEHSAVSEPVARQMALGVLEITPEAQLSAAVTGHLGPDSPAELDGVVYIAIAQRRAEEKNCLSVTRHHLESQTRLERQQEAAALVLQQARLAISPR